MSGDAHWGQKLTSWGVTFGAGRRSNTEDVREPTKMSIAALTARVAHLEALKDRRQRRQAPPEDARRAIADKASRLGPMGLTPVGGGGY